MSQSNTNKPFDSASDSELNNAIVHFENPATHTVFHQKMDAILRNDAEKYAKDHYPSNHTTETIIIVTIVPKE